MTVELAVSYDGATAEELQARVGAPVIAYDSVTSTLDVAHQLAAQGAESGTVLLADAQTAGRGQHGRSWTSESGRGVWSTTIWRPESSEGLSLLSLRAGLALADALDQYAERSIGLKWPNDLLVDSRKLGGILIESRWGRREEPASAPLWVAIGVGINLHPSERIPDAAGLARTASRPDVFVAVARAIQTAMAARSARLSSAELDRYAARDVLRNRRILSPARGTVAGISADGELVVQTEDGVERHRTGTVRLDS